MLDYDCRSSWFIKIARITEEVTNWQKKEKKGVVCNFEKHRQ